MDKAQAATANPKRYPYEIMKEQQHALEQLHADFRWGPYGIRVVRFHLAAFSPGKIDRFHKHSEEFEFHFVARGKGMVILEETPYSLSEGMMYLTAPQVMHYQEADPREGMDELCLRIEIIRLEERQPDAAEWGMDKEWQEAEACVRLLNDIPLRPEIDRFRAMDSFLVAYKAWYEGQPGLFTVIQQAIKNIALGMIRAYFPEPQRPSAESLRDMNRYRYRLAEQFMKDNFQEPLTIGAVADRVQVSPRQLQRIFLGQSGITFSDCMEQIRLTRVCKDLEQSDLTIEQLAVRNGFSSANYLHRIFKRRFGMTPKRYREQALPSMPPFRSP